MCSTSPAATANRRSGRTTWSTSEGRTQQRATRSRTSTGATTAIRRMHRGCPERALLARVLLAGELLARELLAPSLAGAVAGEIIEGRCDALTVPVARNEPDALARGPAPASRVAAGEVGAVDDEIAAPRRLHHLDHMPRGREVDAVVVMIMALISHAVCQGRQQRARQTHRHGQSEPRRELAHSSPPREQSGNDRGDPQR